MSNSIFTYYLFPQLALTICVFLANQRPRPKLSEEQDLRVVAFNSLTQNICSFRVVVTTSNFQKYRFFPRRASLPVNLRRSDTVLDHRARTSSGKLLLTYLFCSFFFLFYLIIFFFISANMGRFLETLDYINMASVPFRGT